MRILSYKPRLLFTDSVVRRGDNSIRKISCQCNTTPRHTNNDQETASRVKELLLYDLSCSARCPF